MSAESMDMYDEKQVSHIEWDRFEYFEKIQKKFIRHSFWKQINSKMSDLLISLISAKNTPKDLEDILKSKEESKF